MTNPRQIEVAAVMDSARFAGLPLLVMVCTAIIMVIDGFDIQVIGFAAPALAAEFGVERSALAPAFAAALIGMAVGGFTLGPWGDRRGRRPTVLLSTLLFGIGTLATAAATNLEEVMVLRFITGIGLGGALPNATALMAEFAPPAARGQAIAAAIVGVPIGGMLGAAIAAELIPAYGWPSVFIVGGVLPLLAVVVLYFLLPESPRYLAAYPARRKELASLLNRVMHEQRYSGEEQFVLVSRTSEEKPEERVGIFSRELLPDTLAVWLVFVTNLFAVYCFYNWAPSILTGLGMDIGTAVRGSLVFNTAGVIGSIFGAWVIARLGSRWPQTILGVIGAVALLGVGRVVSASAGGEAPVALIMTGFAIAGFGILAVQVTAYVVTAHVYPTACRSAGIGWAVGMGRIGGVLSAFAGAPLMARTGAAGLFVAIAMVLVLTVIGVSILRRHIPPRTARVAARVIG